MRLGLLVNRNWFTLTVFAWVMLLVHAAQGWYPLLPVLRRLGLHTPQEIQDEQHAMLNLWDCIGGTTDAAGADA